MKQVENKTTESRETQETLTLQINRNAGLYRAF